MGKSGKPVTVVLAAVLLAISFGIFLVSLSGKTSAGKNKESVPEAVETAAGGAINWGLSFRQEGQPPEGNASKEELAEFDAFFMGDDSSKDIYLTFDAGYENGYMEEILDVLKDKKVSATFFVVGTYIKENPELIRRMTSEGHTVGNHTMNHPDMSAISGRDDFEKELLEVEEAYEEVTGTAMSKCYRPPRGIFSFDNLKMAQDLGYKTYFWSLAYVDWNQDSQPKCEDALNTLTKRSHDGMVILLHSTSKTNCKILGQMIDKWKAMGYEFKPLSELSK